MSNTEEPLPQEPNDNTTLNSGKDTRKIKNRESGITRRSLLLGVGGVAVLMGLGASKYAWAQPLIRPPGGQDEDNLLAGCIRCEKCFEICPRNVIAPAHIEDGLVSIRTPTFDFSDDYCDFCLEENEGKPLCAAVCTTKALELPEGANEINTIIGIAEINTTECLAYRLIGCRFCYDACPYEAMEMDDSGLPSVINDKCNGCGACESVCVSLKNGSVSGGTQERAIVVRPLAAEAV